MILSFLSSQQEILYTDTSHNLLADIILTLYLLTRLLVHRWSWQNVMLCARLACSAKPYPRELRSPGVYLCVLLSKFPALYALGQLNGVWRVCQFPVSCPVFTSLAFNTIAYCFFQYIPSANRCACMQVYRIRYTVYLFGFILCLFVLMEIGSSFYLVSNFSAINTLG